MIFKLYYCLVYTGWFAVTVLLGSYMSFHAEARDADLGVFFMITPVTIFLRPLISAHADRKQSHKSLLVAFLLVTCVAYIPFILWPFYKHEYQAYIEQKKQQDEAFQCINWPFWVLSMFHTIGSIGFCGARALGDATAVNFAKQTGGDFSEHRVFGSYSYGLAGYLIGFVNENNAYFPDFVPGILLHCVCLVATAVLIYAWPHEYFKMSLGEGNGGEKKDAKKSQKGSPAMGVGKFPRGAELWGRIRSKLCCGMLGEQPLEPETNGQAIANSQLVGKKSLSITQQVQIFLLLMKRDFRVPLYLLIIFYAGLTAYAPLNFVFIYLDDVCRTRGSCSGAEISALVIIGFCILEGVGYKLIERFRVSWTAMLQVVLVSIAGHYYFYAFLLDKLSPYWFVVESLHGIEYAFSLVLCINLGYTFAREVDLIIPELIERGTVSQSDAEEQELVRVSLMATMSSLYTLVYDGAGCSFGALVFGQIAGRYSFQTLWICIATLAVVGFVLLLIGNFIGNLFNIKPTILKLEKDKSDDKSSAEC